MPTSAFSGGLAGLAPPSFAGGAVGTSFRTGRKKSLVFTGNIYNTSTPGASVQLNFGSIISASLGSGTLVLNVGTFSSTTACSDGSVTIDATATFPVEDWCTVSSFGGAPPGYPVNATLAPEGCAVIYTWRPDPNAGNTITGTIRYPGGTYNINEFSANNPPFIDVTLRYLAGTTFYVNGSGYAVPVNAGATLLGIDSGMVAGSDSHTATIGGFANTLNRSWGPTFAKMNGTISAYTGVGYTAAECFVRAGKMETLQYTGEFLDLNGAAIPETISVVAANSNKTFPGFTTQPFPFTTTIKNYGWAIGGFNVAGSVTENYENPDYDELYLDKSSIIATGYATNDADATDYWFSFPCQKFPILQISHSDYTIDAINSPSGWTGVNCTIATGGLGLRIVAPSAIGIATKVYSALYNLEGHRYLTIQVKSVGSSNQYVNVALASFGDYGWKEYVVQTGVDGVLTSCTIDLCLPTGFVPTFEYMTTRYPSSNSVRPFYYPEQGFSYGVNQFDRIRVTVPAASTIEIGSLQTKSTDPRISAFESGEIVSLHPAIGGYAPQSRPILFLNSDGRMTDLAFDSDVNTLVSTLNQISGIAASIPSSGSPFDVGSTGAFSLGWATVATTIKNVPLTSSAMTIFGHLNAIIVKTNGEFGDGFGTGAVTGPTQIHLVKYMRSKLAGIVYTSAGKSSSGSSVQYIRSSGGAIDGLAAAATDGHYVTASPGGNRTNHFGKSGSTAGTSFLPAARHIYRFCALWVPNPSLIGSIGYDVNSNYRHVRTGLPTPGGTGQWQIGMASNNPAVTFVDRDSGLIGAWARPRWSQLSPAPAVGVFYGDGTSSTWSRSYDEGQTWVDGIAIGGGIVGDFNESHTGLKTFYEVRANVPGGGGPTTYDVWMKQVDNQLNVVTASQITNLTGVDQAPIACRESTAQAGQWRIGLTYYIGGVLTTKFSFDGITFA